MGEGFQFLDIILFGMIAVFLIMRLRSVLGRRTGHQQQRDLFPGRTRDQTQSDKVIPLPDRSPTGPAESSAKDTTGAELPGVVQIQTVDAGFSAGGFLKGARAAFELIVGAFAVGDTGTLRPLLSDEVFENFTNAIKERLRAKQTLETTLVGITSAEVVEAELQGRMALVTVKFVSEQINVTRDAEGNVVDGDPSHVTTVTDLWTFARNTRSRDPNWALVATRSPT